MCLTDPHQLVPSFDRAATVTRGVVRCEAWHRRIKSPDIVGPNPTTTMTYLFGRESCGRRVLAPSRRGQRVSSGPDPFLPQVPPWGGLLGENMNGKAQRSFPVKVRDIALDVTVEYEVDDPEYWEYVSAVAEDGADLMDFLYGAQWFPQFDRECALEMNEFQNTREDAMDAVHAAIETKMMEEK